MRLYNTKSKKIDEVTPITDKTISFYSCGPTVYDVTHIGHLRTYINNDILKRTLQRFGFKVNHVMNITDVGHLSGDDDSGVDKLEKGAAKTGKTVWDVAQFYTDYFTDAIQKVNILPANHLVKATDHITEMITLIQTLEKKGFTYDTPEAVYFDISKWPSYGSLSGQKLDDKLVKSRDEVVVDTNKKQPADFALWFKRVGRFADHTMYWESPWGDGFPGWHIECSAMSMKYLGETIDIHAGGVDHIPVHHENEIAQSEAATGKPFVHLWFHNNHLLVNGEKMSKSLGNFMTLDSLIEKGIDPIALRYLFLQTHYRQIQNYTDASLSAAVQAYSRLKDTVVNLRTQSDRVQLSAEKLEKVDVFRQQFMSALANDLQVPQALAGLWETVKSNIPSIDKLDLLYEFDEVLGLGLKDVKEDEPLLPEVDALVKARDAAKAHKDYSKSDEIRAELETMGYAVRDTATGTSVTKKN